MCFLLNPKFSNFSIGTLLLFVYTYLAFFASQLAMFWDPHDMFILVTVLQYIQIKKIILITWKSDF
jgi:hypothetical protein